MADVEYDPTSGTFIWLENTSDIMFGLPCRQATHRLPSRRARGLLGRDSVQKVLIPVHGLDRACPTH